VITRHMDRQADGQTDGLGDSYMPLEHSIWRHMDRQADGQTDGLGDSYMPLEHSIWRGEGYNMLRYVIKDKMTSILTISCLRRVVPNLSLQKLQ